MSENTDQLTMSVKSCARLLGISRGLAFAMIKQGRLPHLKFGRRILIPKQAIDELLRHPENSQGGTSVDRDEIEMKK